MERKKEIFIEILLAIRFMSSFQGGGKSVFWAIIALMLVSS